MRRFSRLGPSAERARGYAAVVAFGVVYLVVARVSIAWFGSVGVHGFSGPIVWPATGLYVGALLAAPRRLWPVAACLALAASLIGHLDAGGSFTVSLGFAVPNAAEGLFVALLVRRGAADRCTLEDPRDLAVLALGGALVGEALFALSAAAVAAYGTSSPFVGSWVRWWISGGLGILLVAPAVAVPFVRLNRARSREKAQAAVVAAGIGAAAVIAAAAHPWDAAAVIGVAIALPFSLWAGWRWGMRVAALCVLAVAVVAAHRGAHDGSLFASGGGASVQVLAVQAAIAVVACASLLASSVAARYRSLTAQNGLLTRAFGEARDKLHGVFRSTSDACVSIDEHVSITAWNRQAEKAFGWSAAEALGKELDQTLVAPAARDSWAAALTTRNGPVRLAARHRSGNELRVELTVAPTGTGGAADLWIRDLTEGEQLRSDAERLQGEVAAKAAELARTVREREQLREDLARSQAKQLQTAKELADAAEALTRAEATREEVERDLRATLELRDQALEDGGRERGRLEEELAAAQSRTAEVERAVEEAAQRHAELVAEHEHLQRHQAETVAELEQARQRQTDTEAELEQAHQRQAETEAELERERESRAETATDLERTRESEAALTAELDDARQRQHDSDGQLAGTRERLAEVERAIAEVGQRLAETAAELEQARQHQAETEAELEQARQRQTETYAELERERHSRAETTTDLERIRQSEAELTAELDRARQRQAETAAELQRSRAAHDVAAAELARASERIGELEYALRSMTESHAGAEAERSQLAAEAERLAAELANLRQTRESAEHALREAQRASAVQERRWIAEQRRLESALRTATETLAVTDHNGSQPEEAPAEVTARYDERGICTYASPSWRDAFGWQQEDLVGRQGNELIHRDDRHLVLRARAQASESHFRARVRNSEGEFTLVETTFRPIRDQDGRLVGVETALRPLPADDFRAQIRMI
jgi:PAS domain S-box-containing protein